jgi:hypothetical protein
MKHRVILATVVLVGICAINQNQTAHARPDPLVPPPGAKAGNPDMLGPLANDQWKAPVATVNPEVLIPDDSTNAKASGLIDPYFKSSFGANAFATRTGSSPLEVTKPIEKIETHDEGALSDQPVAAVAAPRSDSKRVMMIALASIALLAFRKLRRPKTATPPKPSFL